jgi:uncharacterized protein YjbJ (UPF0337 family)
MNWDEIKGRWNELSGRFREEWSKISKDEMDQVAGSRRELLGKIQAKYGMAREEAERRLREFQEKL